VSPDTRTGAARPSRAEQFAVAGVGVLLLALGATGALPVATAVAAGVGAVALWSTVHLVRTALAIHHAHGNFTACKGAGFVGMGALAAGLTAVLPVVVATPVRSGPVAAGLAVAAALFALGTLLLPGAATSVQVRLRRAFDGLGLGVSLGFAAWLMPPVGATPPAALLASLCTAAGIAVITVTVLRAVAHRRAALRCGFGAIAVLLGLYFQVALIVYGSPGRMALVAAVLVVAGLVLTADGATEVQPLYPPPPEARDTDIHLSGYPLLAIPALVGVLAALYHLITVGSFDRTSIVLGIAMVSVLTMRELLAVGDIRRYARRLATQEAHFRSLVAGATDLTLVLDGRLLVRWQSPAAARLFGLADSDVVGRPFLDLLHDDDAQDVSAVLDAILAGGRVAGSPALVNARIRDGFGAWRDTESTISDQRGVPEVAALVVHVRDVGERKHLERALQKLTFTDQLTGLANRRALMRDLDVRRQAPGRPGALLVLDLHGLAQINDGQGREIGDVVLVEVGRRIRTLLGEQDVAARLGGDEFAVLTSDGAVLAFALATRLVSALVEPYQLPGTVVTLHVSIGLAEVSAGSGVDDVLRQADVARRRARQLGRDRVEWYDTDLEEQLLRRMDLEREVNGAAARGELDLVFQPILSLRDGRPVGAEALLRWRHPHLGTILPTEILPIAHSVGVGTEIGDWVIDAACRRLRAWSELDPNLWMAVNVAPRELLGTGFPDRVGAALTRHGLAGDRLVVEVAETWVDEDVPAVVAALAELRQLGVRAALDDFGAGQASLAHLRRLPVDMLKLDRSLISVPTDVVGGHGVLDVVVSLGRRLGLEIVAEGLERPEHVELATRAGCLYGQGLALARPGPAERIEAYLEEHRASSS
jgi:diguanylate cyclase (GGDEF)-like protein/PAS domain S-box-containing protein